MNHIYSLKEKYFNLIKDGKKILELRLFDEKRRKIKNGDTITFWNGDENNAIIAEVIRLYKSDSFLNLVKLFDIKQTGFNKMENLFSVLNEFYPLEKQKEYGVLGIEIKLIK